MNSKHTIDRFLYGILDGELVHVDTVANGLLCNCICPACSSQLVACNNPNNKKQSYFRHYSKQQCKYAHETALHLLAKKVLESKGEIVVPDYEFIMSGKLNHYNRDWVVKAEKIEEWKAQRNSDMKDEDEDDFDDSWFGFVDGNMDLKSYMKKIPHLFGWLNRSEFWFDISSRYFAVPYDFNSSKVKIQFDSIELEKAEGDFKPDLKCHVKDRTLLIEIAVTHFVDKEKENKIKKAGIPLLEMDLSKFKDFTQYEKVEELLQKDETANMKWILNDKITYKINFVESLAKKISEWVMNNRERKVLYGKDHKIYNCPESRNPVTVTNACEGCNGYLGMFFSHTNESGYPQKYIECVGHLLKEFEELIFNLEKEKWLTINHRYYLKRFH